jgi:hypothetical protein
MPPVGSCLWRSWSFSFRSMVTRSSSERWVFTRLTTSPLTSRNWFYGNALKPTTTSCWPAPGRRRTRRRASWAGLCRRTTDGGCLLRWHQVRTLKKLRATGLDWIPALPRVSQKTWDSLVTSALWKRSAKAKQLTSVFSVSLIREGRPLTEVVIKCNGRRPKPKRPHFPPSSSGSLAMLLVMRRASSSVSTPAMCASSGVSRE